MDYSNLIQKSIEAQVFSYSPYSNFKVGAALLSSDKKIFTGANIESASFSLTICAERVVFSKAISEGVKNFEAIAISSNSDSFVYPCGACRQFMFEFEENLTVILVKSINDFKIHKLEELIPFGFNLRRLNINK